MRLDFVIPGFSKCGTTTLCALLGEHPQIFIPAIKEPCHFAYEYAKGWARYEKFYRDAAPGQLCGDGSTCYSSAEYAPISCQRLLQAFPDVRLIFIARDPITRLESSYRELHHKGYRFAVNAPYSIAETLEQFPNMVADTMYWRLINVYRDRIPDERILVLFLEDFQQDPAAAVKRCFEFLGVQSDLPIGQPQRRLNTRDEKRYDSRLMRFIRTHQRTNEFWENLSDRQRQRWERILKLRRPFRGALRWPDVTRARLIEQIGEDARRFLTFYGKPADFWDLSPRARAAAA